MSGPNAGAPGTAGNHYRSAPLDTTSEARAPEAAQTEVIDLLEWNPDRRRLVCLTLHDWHRVDQVAAALAEARRPAIPTPRTEGHGRPVRS